MSEKAINSRIIHKHDTEANWLLATNFTPKKGEIIVYDIDANYNYERFKIGDGTSNVNDLPFLLDSKLDKTGGIINGNLIIDTSHVAGEGDDEESVEGIFLPYSDDDECYTRIAAYVIEAKEYSSYSEVRAGNVSVGSGSEEGDFKIELGYDGLSFYEADGETPNGKVTGLTHTTDDTAAVPLGQMKEYAMPKYNEGILTYQDDPSLEGKIYCVDIPGMPELKPGMEITIIPHVTSKIGGPGLSINGEEAIGMRVTASTSNSSFNGTRPDFLAEGAPLKLMYIERRTQAQAAYAVLPNGQTVTMKEPGAWANGYYIVSEVADSAIVYLYNSEQQLVETLTTNSIESDYISSIDFINDYLDKISVEGTWYFSNGTDESSTYLWRIMNSVRVNAEALMSNNANGGGMYACTPGKANEKLLWNTPTQVGIDINKNYIFKAKATDSNDDGATAYSVEIPGITSCYNGLIIMVSPDTVSGSTEATLDLNGFGGKPIRLPGHTSGAIYYAYSKSFLAKNKPVLLMYDSGGNNGRWIAINLNRPVAESISGQVAVANGGTGRSSLTSGRYLVGNGTGAVTLRTKAQVLSDIGAVSLSDFNAILARVEALENDDNVVLSFGFNHQNFNFVDGMTWEDFINSDYNVSATCPECGEESSTTFYIDPYENGDSDGVYFTQSGDSANGCMCTDGIRLPVNRADRVYSMDYDLIVKILKANEGNLITFYINTGDEEISYRAEDGMTWSQFINSSYNESIECPSCGGEISNFDEDGTYIHFNLAQSGCLMEAKENDDYSYVLSTGGDYIELSDIITDNTTYEIGFP